MKFLANENYPLTSVKKLKEAGHEVESVTLMMRGQPDEAIPHKAATDQSIILTFDRDYGKLIYQLKLTKPGGIFYYTSYLYICQKSKSCLRQQQIQSVSTKESLLF